MKVKIILKWVLPVLAVLATVFFIGYSVYASTNPWFYGYWCAIAVVIVAVAILSCFSTNVRRWIGYHTVGQLFSNNNSRWYLHLIVAVIISIAAMLNGFGRPILSSSAKELKNTLVEKAKEYPSLTHEIKRSLIGTNNVPTLFAKSSTPVAKKQYPSWWWWIWAFILWVALVIHAPFAFYDEAIRALKEALKKIERRKRLNNIRASANPTAPATQAPTAPTAGVSIAPAAETVTVKEIWKKVLQANVLTEAAEIFIKLIFKKWAGWL